MVFANIEYLFLLLLLIPYIVCSKVEKESGDASDFGCPGICAYTQKL